MPSKRFTCSSCQKGYDFKQLHDGALILYCGSRGCRQVPLSGEFPFGTYQFVRGRGRNDGEKNVECLLSDHTVKYYTLSQNALGYGLRESRVTRPVRRGRSIAGAKRAPAALAVMLVQEDQIKLTSLISNYL